MKRSTDTRDAAAKRRRNTTLESRNTRKRQSLLETLEGRTLLSYTFSYNSGTQTATATGTSAVDSIKIEPVSGYLEYSVNGAAFSGSWGGSPVPAAPTVTVNVALSSGDGSSITFGTPTGAASALLASFNVTVPTNTTDTETIDDSAGTTLASNIHPYTVDTINGTVSGPGFTTTSSTHPFAGGTTLKGSAVNGDIYNVDSVVTGGQFNLKAGAAVTNTVNVGYFGSLGGIGGTLAVTGPATLNVDDHNDFDQATATLDNASTNANAPFELTGLSLGAIEYGPAVTALNILGGTSVESLAGVTFDVNNTQAATTTTITGGPNQNFFNVSNPASGGGLDNLPGPVVVHGGTALNDVVTLEDSNANFNDSYTITGTTVTRARFGGLTYDANIGTLTLNAESVSGSNGNNAINVNSTANGVTTNINGQGGSDTIDVNSTGTGATVNVTAGKTASSTVNVIADNEPVNVTFIPPDGDGPDDVVNIGSTGGAGSMTGILGAIDIINQPTFFVLSFHDENDTTAQTWTLDNDDSNGVLGLATVALGNGIATTTYRPGDLEDPLTLSGGSGGNTFNVDNTTSDAITVLNTGTGDDTTNVLATGNDVLDINGQDRADTVNLGNSLSEVEGMQGLTGTINLGNASGKTTLNLLDQEDTTGRTVLSADDGITNTFTGISPATINANSVELNSLNVFGGSGGNAFTINGTFSNGSPESPSNFLSGAGNDTTTVEATAANSSLTVDGQSGTDTVLISNAKSVTGILGNVLVDNDLGLSTLTIDASADITDHDAFLSGGKDESNLVGLAPAEIDYVTTELNSLTVDTGPTGNQVLQVDFDTYNPIPANNSAGLTFNGGANTSSAPNSHTLVFFDELTSGPFQSEVHNAEQGNGPNDMVNDGTYNFVDADQVASNVEYSGLQANVDFTPVVNYTMNEYGSPDQSFSATDGPSLDGLASIEFQSKPTPTTPLNFVTTMVSLKQDITFITPMADGLFSAGVDGSVNIPIASAALNTLTFNTPTGAENKVSFVNVPSDVVTSLNGGTDEDSTLVTGVGVSTEQVLVLRAGPGQDTLTYDAGGLIPTVSSTISSNEPGPQDPGVLITIPGYGVVEAIGYENINIVNVASPVLTVSPAQSITVVEGQPLTNVLVGAFNYPLPGTIFSSSDMPVSDFTASVNWGDEDPAATITDQTGNQGNYDITGSHTYGENGVYHVSSFVGFIGGTISSMLNGSLISITYPATSAFTDTPTTVTVTQGSLSVTALPVVGTAGASIASAPIATFLDSGLAEPASEYTATIILTNSSGVTTTFDDAVVTRTGSTNQYTVFAPTFTPPATGKYTVMVSVTDNGGANPTTGQGTSTAEIADATLSAGSPVLLTANTGVITGGVVAHFTDANPFIALSGFTSTIEWGDDSSSPGTITQPGGVGTAFVVNGSHTYDKPGTYTRTVFVTDNDGAVTTLIGMTTVTDPAVVGSTRPITATEGISTGQVVLATFLDPNPTATVADLNAALAANGWGDGSPTDDTLTIRQIGVTPLSSLTNPGARIFEVLGSHTYNQITSAGSTDSLSLVITSLDGTSTTLTSPQGGGVTVITPVVTGSTRPITATQGLNTGQVVLATFTDSNTSATVADLSATLAPNGWGDGSPTDESLVIQQIGVTPLSSLTNPGAPIFEVLGNHTYSTLTASGMTDSLSVIITTLGGTSTTLTSPLGQGVTVLDARLTSTNGTSPTGVEKVSTGPVLLGTFTDANPLADLARFSATVNWGDGSTSAATITQPGGVGTPFLVTGSHTFTTQGVYTYVVTVTDPGGQTATSTGAITQVDQPPVAVNDTYTTAQDQPPLNVVAASGLMANDSSPTSNPLTCLLVTTPSHGQININQDGSFTYTPTPGFVGTDTFTYRDYDGQTLGNVASVSIVVTPPLVGPKVAGDYNGDGKSDIAIYLPSIGAFAIRYTNGMPDQIIQFGMAGAGNSIPAPGDYDGSGKTELAVYLPTEGDFAYRPANGGPDQIIPFGLSGKGNSIPAPGDYDGSGKTELAVYLPSLGEFVYRPANGGPDKTVVFGMAGLGNSIPVPGDYDGSGKTEFAVYMPSTGDFAYRPANGGPDQIIHFGLPGAGNSIPMPGDYDGSGKTELAVYIPSTGTFAYRPANGGPDIIEQFGVPGNSQTLPSPGDYTGVGHDELAGYVPAYGSFAIRTGTGSPDVVQSFGIVGLGQTVSVTTVDQALAEMTTTTGTGTVSTTSVSIPDATPTSETVIFPTVTTTTRKKHGH